MDLTRHSPRLAVLIVLIAGCGAKREPVPVAWTGPNKGPAAKPAYQVLWKERIGHVPIADRIKALQQAVPDRLFHRLTTTRSVPEPMQLGKGNWVKPPAGLANGMISQSVYDARATVISLDPDVMIVTVRKRPAGSYEDLFLDSQERTAIRKTRLIAYDDRHGATLSAFADTRLPASSEMYVVSTEGDVKSGPLEFDGDRAEIPFAAGKLIVLRNGDVADVVQE